MIVDRNYERARRILVDNIDKLHTMADALIKYETIDSDQIDDIMSGREIRPPKGWGEDPGSGRGGASAGTSSGDKSPDATIDGRPAGQH